MWNGPEQALYWIDALAPAIHRLGADGELSTWPMPCPIGSFVFRRSGGLIGALKGGFCAIDLMRVAVDRILDPEPDRPETTLNDGKCDRRGRYWCGSRDGALAKPTGRLFRLDPDLRCRTMDEGFIVSNGIAWSPDDRTMYFADSRAETVWPTISMLDDGEIRIVGCSSRRGTSRAAATARRSTPTASTGVPSCMAAAVARIDPTGRLDRLIAMPGQARDHVQLRRTGARRALRDERSP